MRRLQKISILLGAQFGLAALAMGWGASPAHGPYVSTLHSSFGVRSAEATTWCGEKCSETVCVHSHYQNETCTKDIDGTCSSGWDEDCTVEGS